MDRRHLAFIIAINAAISLVIALIVVWIVEARRPDLDQLAAQFTPMAPVILASTPTAMAAVEPPTATPAVLASAETDEGAVYIVQAGDILSSIASRFGVPLAELAAANGLTDPNAIYSGQRLLIPAAAATAAAGTSDATPVAGGNPQISGVEGVGLLAQEFVLIVNESNAPVDLAGWQLQRDGGPTYTFDSLPLFAGSSVRVYSSEGVDSSIARYWGERSPVWSGGAEAQLRDASGAVVHRYLVP